MQCRSKGDPILYINNPGEIDSLMRPNLSKPLIKINQLTYDEIGDPEILTTKNSRFLFQGRNFRLTDVSGKVIREIL